MIFSLLPLVLVSFTSFAGSDDNRDPNNQQMMEISSCYSKAADRDSTLMGTIELKWSVNDKGAVTKSSVDEKSTTLKDKELQSCMLKKLNKWKFPPAPKGKTIEVRYPFDFSQSEPKDL